MDDIGVEIIQLKENGYNVEIINESFFEWIMNLLKGTVGNVPEAIPQLGKEYVVDWLLRTLGIGDTSYFASVISAAIGNIPITEYGRLFSDCKFTTHILSKSLIEGVFKMMVSKSEMSGLSAALLTTLRNSLADTLLDDTSGTVGAMAAKLEDFLCGKLNKVNTKMISKQKEITDKALSSEPVQQALQDKLMS